MTDLDNFVEIFRCELIDDQITKNTIFKKHNNWSSLVSLIIITSIEASFGELIDIDTLRNSDTIEELYQQGILSKN